MIQVIFLRTILSVAQNIFTTLHFLQCQWYDICSRVAMYKVYIYAFSPTHRHLSIYTLK